MADRVRLCGNVGKAQVADEVNCEGIEVLCQTILPTLQHIQATTSGTLPRRAQGSEER